MKERGIIFFALAVMLISSCHDSGSKSLFTDTPKQGTINISVDESFKSVIEQEIKVYHSTFPETNIIASYKPEVECFKDLQNDSTRMVIVARGLNTNEQSFFEDKLHFRAQFDAVAYDAVAVIYNIHGKDSVFTLKDLKNILSGKNPIIAVMDGNNATSTVRYLQDSILRGVPFGKNVVAAEGSRAVIEAVSKNEHAIGFVGSSWVTNMDEPEQVANLKKIQLASVECVTCKEKNMFARPSQETITFSQYPLARPLFYIVKENVTGLGTGFCNFMSLERGQLIFRRASLAPGKMDFQIRKTNIDDGK